MISLCPSRLPLVSLTQLSRFPSSPSQCQRLSLPRSPANDNSNNNRQPLVPLVFLLPSPHFRVICIHTAKGETAKPKTMSSRGDHQTVPLSVLLRREQNSEKVENSELCFAQFNQSKKGEDFTLIKTECQRIVGDGVATFSVFGLFDGHNGTAAAIYVKEHLLSNVLDAIPSDLSRDDWVAALPRALVAGFVKTDKDFLEKGQASGTTVTFVIIDGWFVTVASVGDSQCIFESAEGDIYCLSADHRLESNVEEWPVFYMMTFLMMLTPDVVLAR